MNVATYRGRCAQHARDRERASGRKGKGKYGTKLWRHRREQQLSREPLCADPLGQHSNYPPIADVVHHLVGIENDPHHRQLQSLCTACHSALHRQGEGASDDSDPCAPPDGRLRAPVRSTR